MFSGIVEEIGIVNQVQALPGKLVLIISCNRCMEGLQIGDSISVNGVCLTVVFFGEKNFTVEAIPETCRLTNLTDLIKGSPVNLERALTPTSRIGGHFVQGHVDGTTPIQRLVEEGDSLKVWLQRPAFWTQCIIPKGFISIDGMSLTIVDVEETAFSICFIPHTRIATIVQNYQAGSIVNLEIDHLTKTIALLVQNFKRETVHG